jgi:hypothetical protein
MSDLITSNSTSKSIACIQLCKGEDYIIEGSGKSSETGEPFDYIMVFDGHGDINKNFMETIRSLPFDEIASNSECPATYIQKTILQKYHPIRAGCTFTCVKVYSTRIDLTSVGDSNALVYINKELVYKSVDHNINNPEEKERLKNQGIIHIVEKDFGCKLLSSTSIEMDSENFHRIQFIRGVQELWLAMTQSLGHHNITGISPEKKIISFDYADKIDIVIATDGLWDIFNPEVIEEDKFMALNATAEEIVNEAEKRWKQAWDLHQDGIIYSDQKFPENNYDDVSVGVWRR